MDSSTKQTVWTLGMIALFAFILSVGNLTEKRTGGRAPAFQAMNLPQSAN